MTPGSTYNALRDSATPEPPSQTAAATYRARQTELRTLEIALQREHIRLGYVRLAFGVATLLLLFPPVPFILIPLAASVLAAQGHGTVLRRLAATRRSLSFYDHGLARLKDRWADLPARQTRLDITKSLYAADLDLFGPEGLFTLLCESRTSLGEDMLAGWLLAPSTVAEVLERQRAIGDLRPRTALREDFAAAPGPALAHLDRNALAAWGEAPASRLPRAFRWGAPLLVALTALAAWRFAAAGTPVFLVAMLALDAGLTFTYARTYKPLFAEAERAQRSLGTLATLLMHIEAQSFAAPCLRALQDTMSGSGKRASEALAKLARLAQWADARSNMLVRIIDAPVLYSLQLGLVLERWRARFGRQLGPWLDGLAEAEALLSLAGYSFEHPEDPFPQFTEAPATLDAAGVGHPLLPHAACVRNDVSLTLQTAMLLISGSNMSGKSTLLRSVGINAVLAFAGAPVRARAFTLSPLTVAACIQVNDSLQAGQSRFYAEILRLRAITEAARAGAPVLFLLDELLAGTNSSDRLEGARGLVQELLAAGAIGLLSTHDLALISLAGDGERLVRNVHFQDQVVEGKLAFDYTLRDGPVQRSNGLALMRLIGLNV